MQDIVDVAGLLAAIFRGPGIIKGSFKGCKNRHNFGCRGGVVLENVAGELPVPSFDCDSRIGFGLDRCD